jgi:hypothetical protein
MYARHFKSLDSKEDDCQSGDLWYAVVYRLSIGSYVAQCSCGWLAPRRLLKAAACQDAWAHAAQPDCQLCVPLVRE